METIMSFKNVPFTGYSMGSVWVMGLGKILLFVLNDKILDIISFEFKFILIKFIEMFYFYFIYLHKKANRKNKP